MNSLSHLSIRLADDQKEQIDRLEEILDGSGITASYEDENGIPLLNIDWDENAVRRIRTRGAGRKPLMLSGAPSVSEVLELQHKHGVSETCRILHISPSTFYRRKKAVKEKYSPDEFADIPF